MMRSGYWNNFRLARDPGAIAEADYRYMLAKIVR